MTQSSLDRGVGLSCAGGRAARGADDKAKAGLGVRKETVPKGRVAFRHAIRQRLLPALRAFNPDLVLLSAGFDGGGTDQGNVKLVDENRPQGAPTLLPARASNLSSLICGNGVRRFGPGA